MNDYLWDRRGPADPDIAALEKTLEPLRWTSTRSATPSGKRRYLAAAAAVLILLFSAWGMLPESGAVPTAWTLTSTGRAVTAGERLQTGRASQLSIEADEFGRIDLGPESELRVFASSPGTQRLSLQRGTLRALIWAPPRKFFVDTPSARAVDLGCQYELSVDPAGDGFLRVQTGWVAFQSGPQESFIPAGAACRTRKATGPGTPFFEDASPALREALDRFDTTHSRGDLAAVLASAQASDGLSLWHVLKRTRKADDRGAVFDHLAKLVNLPPEVSRDKVVALDPGAIDLCWNALGLDSADWWREWKQDWRP